MNYIIKIKLGEVEFNGEIATAFREVYDNGEWKFVLMLNNQRIVVMSY